MTDQNEHNRARHTQLEAPGKICDNLNPTNDESAIVRSLIDVNNFELKA